MDDKYNISKSREPLSKQEKIQHEIEELVKRRDKLTSPAEIKTVNAEIAKLFAQWQRLKL
jgi:hypothetical protein